MSTPFLAKLQAQTNSIQLTQSYSTHRCSPTRAAFLTGRYPFRYGLGVDPITKTLPTGLPLSQELLPSHLKKAGYRTRAYGKWHLGYGNSSYLPENRGFDSFYGFYGPGTDYFTHKARLNGRFPYKICNYFNNSDLVDTKHGTYITDDLTDEFLAYFNTDDKSAPSFTLLAYNAPHEPISAPQVEVDQLRQLYSERYNSSDQPSEKYLEYHASIRIMDRSIERIYNRVMESERETIIVFMSDNGAALVPGDQVGCNFPYRGKKSTLLEGGTLSPTLVISTRHEFKKNTNSGLIHIVDWFPTILSMAKANYNGTHLDGVDQTKMIFEEKVWRRKRKEPFTARSAFIYGAHHVFNRAADGKISTQIKKNLFNF